MTSRIKKQEGIQDLNYQTVLGDIANVIDTARRSAARSVNSIMTAAYWLIGRRIVESEQKGEKRAGYGEELLKRLSVDLGEHFGHGFGVDNLQRFHAFYLGYPPERIYAALSRIFEVKSTDKSDRSILQTVSAESSLSSIASCFRLPWSAYVRLLSVKNENARRFYETEGLRGGWSIRQLDRQINSQFYERTAIES
jgi:hypothetical protein